MLHQDKLIGDLEATFEQGCALLRQLTDAEYTTNVPELGASSIGAHYRHHLDHVRAVVVALADGTHVVDYDDRIRGTDIEFDRSVALNATRELMTRLRELVASGLEQPVTVLQRSCADGDVRPASPSSAMRELAFLQSHAVHHFALMALVARVQGITLPCDFGVMPSTARYHAERAMDAR